MFLIKVFLINHTACISRGPWDQKLSLLPSFTPREEGRALTFETAKYFYQCLIAALARTIQPDHMPISVNCVWGPFREGPCDRICGGGTKIMTRRISRPARYGGRRCYGPSTMTQACNENPCPGEESWTIMQIVLIFGTFIWQNLSCKALYIIVTIMVKSHGLKDRLPLLDPICNFKSLDF